MSQSERISYNINVFLFYLNSSQAEHKKSHPLKLVGCLVNYYNSISTIILLGELMDTSKDYRIIVAEAALKDLEKIVRNRRLPFPIKRIMCCF